MDFKSSPLGALYGSLLAKTQLKEDQNLDECELRADSKRETDLRVKTEKRSGWSSKARKAHQTHARNIVKDYFHRSVIALIDLQNGLTYTEKGKIRDAGTRAWQEEVMRHEYLTPGMLQSLHMRAVGVFKANLPEQQLSPHSFGSSSFSSSSSLPPPRTGLASAEQAQVTVVHPAPQEPLAVHVHASPSGGPVAAPAAALTALKAQYPLSSFPAEHGENDAHTSQARQAVFHGKLESLVTIAGEHLPRTINSQAIEGGCKTLAAAAAAMKHNPGMHPAVAIYQQLVGPEAAAFYKHFPGEVDAHVSQLTQMSSAEIAEMRGQVRQSK